MLNSNNWPPAARRAIAVAGISAMAWVIDHSVKSAVAAGVTWAPAMAVAFHVYAAAATRIVRRG